MTFIRHKISQKPPLWIFKGSPMPINCIFGSIEGNAEQKKLVLRYFFARYFFNIFLKSILESIIAEFSTIFNDNLEKGLIFQLYVRIC